MKDKSEFWNISERLLNTSRKQNPGDNVLREQNEVTLLLFLFFFFFFFVFLGQHLWHMEVPRLGVESELWPPAYATDTATPDLSRVCDLYHSSRHHWIRNPVIEARDRTSNLESERALSRTHTPQL